MPDTIADVDIEQIADPNPEMPYNELISPEGHEDVGKELIDIVYQGIQWKESQGYFEKWSMYEDMSRNVHYEDDEDTAGLPLTSMNLLWKHRQKTLDMVFANNPTFNAKAVGVVADDQRQKLKLVERATTHYWREQNVQETLKNVVGWFGETDGTYLGRVRWDKEAEGGIGEIAVDGIDPRYFVGYPVDETKLQSLEAAILLKPMSVRAARRQYPQFADKIQADEDIISKVEAERVKFGKTSTDFQYEFSDETWSSMGMASGENDDKKTLICECYIKDYSGKYTGNIRLVTICSAGTVVLEDGDNPNINPNMPPEWQKILYLNDKFPFFKAQSNPDPTCFWGGSDFDQLVEANKDLDEALTFFNLIEEASADVTRLNPKDSGVQDEDLDIKGPKTVRPHTAAHGQGIRYLEPPPIPPAITAGIQLHKENFYELSQTFNMDQAKNQGRDVISAKAIGLLTEQENRTKIGKQGAVEYCIIECGRMITSLMQSHYIDDRLVSYFENGDEQEATVNYQALQVPVRLTIVPGSTMPVSKAAEQEKTMALFDKKMIPLETALQRLEVEGWREIVAKMKEGPIGEFMQKLSAILPVPPETLQAIAKIMQMDPKEFEKAMKAGEIGKIQLPQPGQDAAAQKDQKLGQDKIAIENSKLLAENDKLAAEREKTKAETIKIQAEREKIMAEAQKIKIEGEVAVEGAKRDKEQLEIEQAKLVKEIATPPKPEKYGDKNTAGFREKGNTSNNRI